MPENDQILQKMVAFSLSHLIFFHQVPDLRVYFFVMHGYEVFDCAMLISLICTRIVSEWVL